MLCPWYSPANGKRWVCRAPRRGGDSLLPGNGRAYNAAARLFTRRRRGAMRNKGANEMGRISIEFEVTNNDDLIRAKDGHLPPDKVRRQRITGVVDSGA